MRKRALVMTWLALLGCLALHRGAASAQEGPTPLPPGYPLPYTPIPWTPDPNPTAEAYPEAETPEPPTPEHAVPTATVSEEAPAQPTEAPVRAASIPAQESLPPTTGDIAPVKLPPSTRLGFEVTGRARGFSYNAQAELLWQHDATSYSAHQEVKVIFLGSRSQSSVGSVTERGLQPRRFGDRSRSERAAHFDFSNGRVTFSANTPAAPIEPTERGMSLRLALALADSLG